MTSRPRGLTLVEPLVALSLLIVLAVLAIPSLKPIVDEAVIKNARRRLQTTILEARALAIVQQTCTTVRLHDDGTDTQWVVHAISPCAPGARDSTLGPRLTTTETSGARFLLKNAPIEFDQHGSLLGPGVRILVRTGGRETSLVVDPSGRVCVIDDDTPTDNARAATCDDGAS